MACLFSNMDEKVKEKNTRQVKSVYKEEMCFRETTLSM